MNICDAIFWAFVTWLLTPSRLDPRREINFPFLTTNLTYSRLCPHRPAYSYLSNWSLSLNYQTADGFNNISKKIVISSLPGMCWLVVSKRGNNKANDASLIIVSSYMRKKSEAIRVNTQNSALMTSGNERESLEKKGIKNREGIYIWIFRSFVTTFDTRKIFILTFFFFLPRVLKTLFLYSFSPPFSTLYATTAPFKRNVYRTHPVNSSSKKVLQG